MSEDEVMATIVSGIVSLIAWLWWYGTILFRRAAPLERSKLPRMLPMTTPFAATAVLLVILKLWASHDVRDSGPYLFMYTTMGIAWTGVMATLSPLFGISLRGDVLRYRNRAAAIVISGWLAAVMLAFAGGNIGDGPHWTVVVFCSLLATASLTVIVVLFQRLAQNNDALTIEHDVAGAVRMAALMIGCGVILGIAVAGDWVSIQATLHDFVFRAWPALALLVVGVAMEKLLRPSPNTPQPSLLAAGVIPALLMAILAATAVGFVTLQWTG